MDKLYYIKFNVIKQELIKLINIVKCKKFIDLDYLIHHVIKSTFDGSELKSFYNYHYTDKGSYIEIVAYSKYCDTDLKLRELTSDINSSKCVDFNSIISKDITNICPSVIGFKLKTSPYIRNGKKYLDPYSKTDGSITRNDCYINWLCSKNSNIIKDSVVYLQNPVTKSKIRSGNGFNTKFSQLEFEVKGIIKINNHSEFLDMLKNGFGRQKAFGFGMYRLFPV